MELTVEDVAAQVAKQFREDPELRREAVCEIKRQIGLIDAKQLAAFLCLSIGGARKWARRHRLQHVVIDSRWRFPIADVERAIKEDTRRTAGI